MVRSKPPPSQPFSATETAIASGLRQHAPAPSSQEATPPTLAVAHPLIQPALSLRWRWMVSCRPISLNPTTTTARSMNAWPHTNSFTAPAAAANPACNAHAQSAFVHCPVIDPDVDMLVSPRVAFGFSTVVGSPTNAQLSPNVVGSMVQMRIAPQEEFNRRHAPIDSLLSANHIIPIVLSIENWHLSTPTASTTTSLASLCEQDTQPPPETAVCRLRLRKLRASESNLRCGRRQPSRLLNDRRLQKTIAGAHLSRSDMDGKASDSVSPTHVQRRIGTMARQLRLVSAVASARQRRFQRTATPDLKEPPSLRAQALSFIAWRFLFAWHLGIGGGSREARVLAFLIASCSGFIDIRPPDSGEPSQPAQRTRQHSRLSSISASTGPSHVAAQYCPPSRTSRASISKLVSKSDVSSDTTRQAADTISQLFVDVDKDELPANVDLALGWPAFGNSNELCEHWRVQRARVLAKPHMRFDTDMHMPLRRIPDHRLGGFSSRYHREARASEDESHGVTTLVVAPRSRNPAHLSRRWPLMLRRRRWNAAILTAAKK
ncbi:hypothetical protein BKA62DRAFT_758934 [Auriculariales sp. MPI-PUGE-AT-0066]|nr:hypothetical protein BKA62DRAFT_758934 [Auriculariales sp. MPI-PUGE-AT-0066]